MRVKGYNILISWPGVLDSPRILDLCENGLNAERNGRKLLDELKRPLLFASSREQNAIEADLARVHAYANDPAKNPSPFQTEEPSVEEVRGFLEAYWLMWQLAQDNRADKPRDFVLTAYKVLRTIPHASLRTHIDLKVEAIKEGSVSVPGGRVFIDTIVAEARGCL